jgi:hypothetical protein
VGPLPPAISRCRARIRHRAAATGFPKNRRSRSAGPRRDGAGLLRLNTPFHVFFRRCLPKVPQQEKEDWGF